MWLEDIVNEKEWRELIYELSESHKKCLMLSFAVQRIAEAGYHEEIGGLTTAAQHYSVFRGIVEKTLERILLSRSDEISELLPVFLKLVSHSAHTVLFTQSILCAIQEATDSQDIRHTVRRVSQELDQYLRSVWTPGQKLWLKIRHLLSRPPSSLAAPLESILLTNSTSPGDMVRLYDAFLSDNPPSVEFIQDSCFLGKSLFKQHSFSDLLPELLAGDLFTPTQIQESFMRKYAFIVAHACSYQPGESEAENTKQRDRLIMAIRGISALCKSPEPVSKEEFVKAGRILDEHLDVSIASAGVLRFVSARLTNPNFYSTPAGDFSIPMFFYILRRIVVTHPFQQSSVFEILKKCFSIETSLDSEAIMDLRKSIIGQMLYLLHNGFALPILQQLREYCLFIDHSLIRHLITSLLLHLKAPFSDSFFRSVVAILALPACQEALSVQPLEALQFLSKPFPDSQSGTSNRC